MASLRRHRHIRLSSSRRNTNTNRNPSIAGFAYTPQKQEEDNMEYIWRLDSLANRMEERHRPAARSFIRSEVSRLIYPINNAPIPNGFNSITLPKPLDMTICGDENTLTGGKFDPERTVILSDKQCYDYDFLIQLYDYAASNPKSGEIEFVSPYNRQKFNENDIAIVFTLKQLKSGPKKSVNKSRKSRKSRR